MNTLAIAVGYLAIFSSCTVGWGFGLPIAYLMRHGPKARQHHVVINVAKDITAYSCALASPVAMVVVGTAVGVFVSVQGIKVLASGMSGKIKMVENEDGSLTFSNKAMETLSQRLLDGDAKPHSS